MNWLFVHDAGEDCTCTVWVCQEMELFKWAEFKSEDGPKLVICGWHSLCRSHWRQSSLSWWICTQNMVLRPLRPPSTGVFELVELYSEMAICWCHWGKMFCRFIFRSSRTRFIEWVEFYLEDGLEMAHQLSQERTLQGDTRVLLKRCSWNGWLILRRWSWNDHSPVPQGEESAQSLDISPKSRLLKWIGFYLTDSLEIVSLCLDDGLEMSFHQRQ